MSWKPQFTSHKYLDLDLCLHLLLTSNQPNTRNQENIFKGASVMGGTLLFYLGWGEVIVFFTVTAVCSTLLWRLRHGFGVKVVVFSYLKLVVLCSLKEAVFYWWAGTTVDFFNLFIQFSCPIQYIILTLCERRINGFVIYNTVAKCLKNRPASAHGLVIWTAVLIPVMK